MPIQIKVRRRCYECKAQPEAGCPDCKGTGWVELWVDLERLIEAIKEGEPLEAAAALDALGAMG